MYTDLESCRTYQKGMSKEEKDAEAKRNSDLLKILYPVIEAERQIQESRRIERLIIAIFIIILIVGAWISLAHAETIPLKASWYSVESLKKEGTWKYSKGVMANGHQFSDAEFTCATRLFPMGTILKVYRTTTGKFVLVKVTDRIGKRFAKTRIDLSKGAFSKIADLKQGVVPCKVEVITKGQ